MQLEKIIAALLLASFLLSNYIYCGKARGVEKFHATVISESSVFAQDEFAECFLKSKNNIIPFIISKTGERERFIIYYGVFFLTVTLMFILGKIVANDVHAALIFMLLMVYNLYNSLSFNIVFLGNDFTGLFLANPFVLASLILFLRRQMILSAVFGAITFYFHPGLALWYTLAVFSYVPVKALMDLRSHTFVWLEWKKELKCTALYFLVFIVLILPRVYETFIAQDYGSVVPGQLSYEILKYSFVGQTSLLLTFFLNPGSVTTITPIAASFLLFILIVQSFHKSKSAVIQLIYFMYLGSWIFLAINEILVHVVEFAPSVTYGLSRASGVNFLLSALLISMMMVEAFKQRKVLETVLWFGFFFNLTVLHYQELSAVLHLILLALIVLNRWAPMRRLSTRVTSAIGSHERLLYRSGLVLFLLGLLLLTSARFMQRQRQEKAVENRSLKDALVFVNEDNIGRSMVLFPFDSMEEYFAYSRNPGFFNTYYRVLFIDTYHFDSVAQKKAYNKFKSLENEFGIETLSTLKEDPDKYSRIWQDAWKKYVNEDFIERWARSYDIGYVIRESDLPDLAYKIVYQNSDYKVYKLEL